MKVTILLVIGAIVSWGTWGFLSKLAVNRIGLQTGFWNYSSLLSILIVFLIVTGQLIPLKNDTQGIIFALLAGVFSGIASILFYMLLGKQPVSLIVAMTSLYPIITLILSVIFLREGLTITKIIGFFFALVALVLLTL